MCAPSRWRFRPAGSALFCLVIFLVAAAPSAAKKTHKVEVRDGVKLATDVHLPEGEGPFPTLLVRTPYGRAIFPGSMEEVLASGYALVIQDMRGRFGSEGGPTYVFTTDFEDGEDTLKWIAAQPWSNGRVGAVGMSALGISQYALFGTKEPALKCQHVGVAAANLVEYAVYWGGVFQLASAGGWVGRGGFDRRNIELLYRPVAEVAHLFQQLNFEPRAPEVAIPIVHVAGWFDIFLKGNIRAFQLIQQQGQAGGKGEQKLLIGPWVHGFGGNRAGELTFPENAKADLLSFKDGGYGAALPFFEWCLKEQPTEAADWAPVRYYVMGDPEDPNAPGNEWRETQTWPPPHLPTPWYFHRDGSLRRQPPQEEEAYLEYVSDPDDFVPTRCGNNLNLPAGPCDQREVEARDDVLVFTSEVLRAPLEVTGPLKAILFASSSAPDTDFSVRLSDVYPDGRSMLISDGIIRGRFRNGLLRGELLQPGNVYRLEVDLWETSLIFNKGHRIRVAVASSNFPRFLINPQTGKELSLSEPALEHIYSEARSLFYEPLLLYPDAASAVNRIHLDASGPSHVVLPLPR